ncbi:MAG: FAD-dependent oxidoreductase [Alphaproteobacteria bacterium]
MSDTTHKAIVIGAGVAGLTAAGELARRGVATALVDDGYLGGLIANVGAIEGAAPHAGQAGPDLVSALLGAALEAGCDYRVGAVSTVARDGEAWILPEIEIAAPSLIMATGAQLRRLGVPGEAALTGRGVSQCAFCDGGLYRDKPVLVVGGGDAAFQEALHLAGIGCAVTILLRGTKPRARPAFVARAEAAANLTLRTGIEVIEIIGADGVDAVRVLSAGKVETLPVAAIFPFVGLAPQTAAAPQSIARDDDGALRVDAGMRTEAPGLHAVGAARSGHGGTLADAVADAMAAANAVA